MIHNCRCLSPRHFSHWLDPSTVTVKRFIRSKNIKTVLALVLRIQHNKSVQNKQATNTPFNIPLQAQTLFGIGMHDFTRFVILITEAFVYTGVILTYHTAIACVDVEMRRYFCCVACLLSFRYTVCWPRFSVRLLGFCVCTVERNTDVDILLNMLLLVIHGLR